MVPLAEAGYHVFAPDIRGYGRTTGWDDDYDGDLDSFRRLNVVRDALGLVYAFGYRSVGVIGPRFRLADRRVVRRRTPRRLHLGRADERTVRRYRIATVRHRRQSAAIQDSWTRSPGGACQAAAPAQALSALLHHPPGQREHVARPQGLHAFCVAITTTRAPIGPTTRRSGWRRAPPPSWRRCPPNYIMDLADGMAETVAKHMPTAAEIAANTWLPDERAGGLCRGIRADRLPGRIEPLSVREASAPPRCNSSRTAPSISRPSSSPAQRLGQLSEPGGAGTDAERGMHRHARGAHGGRRRSLGAAGATRGNEPLVDRISEDGVNRLRAVQLPGSSSRRFMRRSSRGPRSSGLDLTLDVGVGIARDRPDSH